MRQSDLQTEVISYSAVISSWEKDAERVLPFDGNEAVGNETGCDVVQRRHPFV